MEGDGLNAFSAGALGEAFAQALGQGKLTPAEREFVIQIADDFRPDELPGVSAADLAANLAAFWRFADTAQGEGPQIRLLHAHGADARDLNLELLEIVQPDAPFLVDSIMGELSEAGFEVRAMFHPVVTVGRDAKGRRT